MSLDYDAEGCCRDILQECKRRLAIVSEKAKQAMIYELSSHAGAGMGTTGRSEWNRQVGEAIDFVIELDTLGVMSKVGLINSQKDYDVMFKSLMLNYGSGSMMDIAENPWLAEYLVSDQWNSNRENHEIMTRPNQTLYDLEEGVWRKSRAKSEYEIPQFSQPPTHFFENGLRLIQSEFNEVLETVLLNFDFSKYLKEVKR